MKILHLCKYDFDYRGGIENVSKSLFNISEDLGNKNYSIAHKASKDFAAKKNMFAYKPLFTFSNMPVSFNYFLKPFFLLKNIDTMIIHGPNPLNFFIALIGYLSKKRVFIYWHSDVSKKPLPYFFFRPFENIMISCCNGIIYATESHFKYSNQHKRLKNVPKFVIPYPPSPNSQELTSELEVISSVKSIKNVENIKIISIGRLVNYKNFDLAIDTLSKLDKKFTLTIVGDGPNKKKLEKKIESLNLKDIISIVSNATNEDLVNMLKDHHLYLFTSNDKAENFGIVQVEALSYGMPIVSCKIKNSGANTININNKTGIVADSFSSDDFKNSILKICSIPEVYNEYSNNALARYKKKYSKKTLISLWEEFFKLNSLN